MEKPWSILGISAALAASAHASAVRQIELPDTDVATIHTALGFSTLIEFPAKPANVVLGDQDNFKVEYIGNSITIKPLVSRGKSNLFVFTEFGRFNLVLLSGGSNEADYLVKVRPPGEPKDPPSPNREPLDRQVKFQGFAVKTVSWTPISQRATPDTLLTIEFEISSSTHPYTFDPRAVGILQDHQFVSIESLYVDSVRVLPDQAPVRGRITLKRGDILSNAPMKLVFAVPKLPNRSSHAGTQLPSVYRIMIPLGQPFVPERRKNAFIVPKDKRKTP